jgi:peptide/nickel transport system ATP-binding protein
MSGPLLRLEELQTHFFTDDGVVRAVDGVSYALGERETLAVVGESGSGKSVTALSILRLVADPPGRIVSGRILFKDRDLAQLPQSEMRRIRGKEISMIFQNPKQSMNPFETAGRQITEAIRLHTGHRGEREARERALAWLDRVKIDSPRLRFDNYPYGLSGGMCQRVMIAMALSCEPSLLIADEPTTGLDATIQSKIVDLLAELKAELGITTMLISHDISIISRLSDTIAVMYGGTVIETGPAREVLSRASELKHPYTAALLASIPSAENIRESGYLPAIEGDVLDTINIPAGCRFYGRCDRVTEKIREKCDRVEPDLRQIGPGHRARCWLYFD